MSDYDDWKCTEPQYYREFEDDIDAHLIDQLDDHAGVVEGVIDADTETTKPEETTP